MNRKTAGSDVAGPAAKQEYAETLRGLIASEILAHPESIAQLVTAAEKLFVALIPAVPRFAQQLPATPPGPTAVEYEKVLVQVGYEPREARFLSIVAIYFGKEFTSGLNESRRRLGSAMRAIANASLASTLLIAHRAKVLLPALYDWGRDWIKDAIEKSDLQLSYEDFHHIAERAAEREPGACRKLRGIAQVLFPYIPKARGKPLCTATVTHAVLLALAHHGPRARSRTYCPILGDFIDPLTNATRCRFDAPQFSPTRAAMLVKSHRLTED